MKKLGFTVVEFLIAIGLSALILIGLVTVYAGNKTSYTVQEGLARIQENGRFLLYHLNKNIRMAGYQGCPNLNNINVNNILDNPNHAQTYDDIVHGYNGSAGAWSPSLPNNLTGRNIKPNTDVIEIRLSLDLGIRLNQKMANVNSAMVLADPDGDGDKREGLGAGDVFMVTDCENADIAATTSNVNAASISVSQALNTTTSLSKMYDVDAKILMFAYYAYYIKDTGRTNRAGNPIYALIQQDIDGNEIELAEGVDDLQLQYGVDTTGDDSADTFVDAQTVEGGNNWDNVMSVSAKLLLTSVDDINTTSQTYTFDSTTTTPTDRVLRREWSTMVTLRNRSFP